MRTIAYKLWDAGSRLAFSFFLFVVPGYLMGRNLRTVSTRDGLSSMFVMSLYQDSLGYMWAGTYNGISLLEGNNAKVLPLHGHLLTQLGGNVVEGIQGGSYGHFWFHSNFGIAHWDVRKHHLERFPEINSIYQYAVSPNDEIIVASQERGLYYFNPQSGQFTPFSFYGLRYSDILDMRIDDQHRWWVVSRTHLYESRISCQSDGTMAIVPLSQEEHKRGGIKVAKFDKDNLFYIDTSDSLCHYSLRKGDTQSLFPMPLSYAHWGRITSMVSLEKDVIVGFTLHGPLWMSRSAKNGNTQWEERDLGITCGVFDIKYDTRQGILWVATDGEGIRYFANEPYEIRTERFQHLPFAVSKPVRALQRDCNGSLWVATKGDGILCYHDYSPVKGTYSQVEHFTMENSPLLHNSVYCLEEGTDGIIWMGSDGKGINYYLPRKHRMGTLNVGEYPIQNVHGLTEVDGELWIATWGHGVYCLHLAWEGGNPRLLSTDQLLYNPDHWELEQFLAIQPDENNVWVASRENGVTQINRRTHKSRTLHFASPRLNALNDVVFVETHSPDGLLFGTSAGLVLQPRDLRHPFVNLSDTLGIDPQPVRSVAYTSQGETWFCTPHSLIQCNTKKMAKKRYGIGNNIGVSEFVERAVYYEPESDVKYFGGTGGFVVVSPRQGEVSGITPEIVFHSIVYMTDDMENLSIIDNAPVEIAYGHNNFTLKYDAVDYLDGDDYTFEYRLNTDAQSWIQNGRNRSIAFINQQPGHYTLQVRYRKGGYLSPVYNMEFRILPPWWLSWPMKFLYVLSAIGLVVYAIYRYIRKQRRRHYYMIERMNERHREEVYESKLRFFTNITHEFSTPLTLISGPCQRILEMPGTNPAVKDYATVIQRSSARLNDLIQQLIEFRRIDTGNRVMSIVETNVGESLKNTATSFCVEAEKGKIDYKVNIQPDLEWPTDANAFTTICINLISNAFKYVKDHGTIRVRLQVNDEDKLQLTVSNTGQGISQEQIDRMFNRYAILEVLEDESAKRGYARNGLGLAITQGLIQALGGTVKVQGEESLTTFTVVLPRQEVNTPSSAMPGGYVAVHHTEEKTIEDTVEVPDKANDGRATILVVDDDKEMTWFLNDILQHEYNVIVFTDPEAAMTCFRKRRIDLVISDIVMSPFDGVELCRRLKRNELTSHIPVILLSSLQNEETQVATANAGADMFMSKPFDLGYFQSVVCNMLRRNRMLKDYFNSSLSAFDVVDGQHLHHEDRELLERIVQIIDANLLNPELSTQFVAKELGIGLRNIYRKLEGITSLTPKEMIREARLERARQLLTKTGMNVEEVCYQAGFNNRGTFYKLFSAKFGCTPRQYHEEKMKEAKGKLQGE